MSFFTSGRVGGYPIKAPFYTVGVGGDYANTKAAVEDQGPRFVRAITAGVSGGAIIPAQTLLFTNGSDLVTKTTPGLGTSMVSADGFTHGMFLEPVVGRKYKIKAPLDADNLRLYEPFQETTTNYFVYPQVIDPILIVLLPGFHSDVLVQPGFHYTGLGLDETVLGEVYFESAPFATSSVFGETSISNLTTGWVPRGGVNDNIGYSIGAVDWCGAEMSCHNVRVRCGNPRGQHNGSHISWPIMRLGYNYIKNCMWDLYDCDGGFYCAQPVVSGKVSSLHIQGLTIHQRFGLRTSRTDLALNDWFNAITDLDYATLQDFIIDVSDLQIYQEELGCRLGTPATQNAAGGIHIASNNVWNINGLICHLTNNNSAASSSSYYVGVKVSAGTANITGAQIDATAVHTGGAKCGVGIYNDGGTINLSNSTITGNRNSVENVSGTLNVEKGVSLVGPVTGTLTSTVRGVAQLGAGGTITVLTTKVHAGSHIQLSRQTPGGTLGFLSLGTIVADTSFVINSSSALDTSTVLWEIDE